MPEIFASPSPITGIAVALLLLCLLGFAWDGLRSRWSRGRARRSMRSRAERALAGERRAVGLLEGAGYHLLAVQPARRFEIRVNGKPRTIALRADLLVGRGPLRFVAEVKTGARAPRIEHRATRRQLLEYFAAYQVDGVLLVDMEARTIHRIEFPARVSPVPARSSRAVLLGAGLVLGVLADRLAALI